MYASSVNAEANLNLEAATTARADAGFRHGDKGTHTSRTIMLEELRTLFEACHQDSAPADYREAIESDNCLGKRTVATRKLTAQRLSELYALDPDLPLFRAMRSLWATDREGRPLLALLIAMARDPLLRASAPPILGMRPGEELSRQHLKDAIAAVAGDRLNASTTDKVVRNVASSWTQSGHLRGRGRKMRTRAVATPAAACLALLLGFQEGRRGEALFGSLWARVLDAPDSELKGLANDARRLGFLQMSQAGGVIDISFSRLLSRAEGR